LREYGSCFSGEEISYSLFGEGTYVLHLKVHMRVLKEAPLVCLPASGFPALTYVSVPNFRSHTFCINFLSAKPITKSFTTDNFNETRSVKDWVRVYRMKLSLTLPTIGLDLENPSNNSNHEPQTSDSSEDDERDELFLNSTISTDDTKGQADRQHQQLAMLANQQNSTGILQVVGTLVLQMWNDRRKATQLPCSLAKSHDYQHPAT
jgi:hypothetical protein